ncbi:MAG TPA: NADPH-dependent F420 reductase [Bryobacteraceae bacterium]|nr:NADPH-dependent F420 reductase [Bryobacteraceae bacterium]
MRVPTTIAVVGGTGAEGSGLALRFAKAGAAVRIGSRNVERAKETAQRIGAAAGSNNVTGHTNPDAAATAEVVVLTVPLAAQIEILKSIRNSFQPGAILVDSTVPLEIAIGGRLSRTVTLWDGSAAQQAARLAPPGVQVVAAFHSLSAEALGRLDQPVDCDTLICGDSTEAKAVVREIAALIPGVKAIDAGTLDNARLLENAAALLISLNLRHKVKHSGIRFTGLSGGDTHS